MAHWKKLMDAKEMLYAFDLDGRDVTITISHVTGGELTGEQGRKTKKPIAHIKGKTKKFALNATNCTTIEQLYGTADVDKWKDIRVTLFPTTTSFGGKTVECIRIRPYLPKDSETRTGRGGNGSRQTAADDAPAESSSAASDVPGDVPTGAEGPGHAAE